MDRDIKKIFGKARLVRMSEERKSLMRRKILDFVKTNPMPAPAGQPSFWPKPVYITISALALVLAVGGAVSAEANRSLPGDVLYPVKVGVNEKILQVLAFSDQQKLKVSIKLAEARLKEAEKLAIGGKMTETSHQEIKQNFNNKANEVAKTLQAMNEQKKYDDAAKIASDFEISLDAHNNILEKVSPKSKNVDSLITEIASAAKKAADSRLDSVKKEIESQKEEAQIKTAQKQMQKAESALSESQELFENEKSNIPPDVMARIQDNLSMASQKINDGKDKMQDNSKDYRQAVILFQQAFITAKQSEGFIKAQR